MDSKTEIAGVQEVPKVWVGLSECDEERERRTAIAKSLFGQLEIDHALLGWAYDLLREAFSCYQNGAFLASTLMCRSGAEAALYTCVTRIEGKTYSSEWEGMEATERVVTKVDMDYINKRFGDFIAKAKTMGLIDTKLEDRITNGRTWGNLGAHYVPTIDKGVVRLMEVETKEEHGRPSPNGLWPTAREAEDVLEESIGIINLLRQNYYRIKPKERR